MPYQKPTVITERTGLAGTPLGNTSFFIPTIIAQSLGEETVVSRAATQISDGVLISDGGYVLINGIAVAVGDTLEYEAVDYNTGGDNLTAAVSHLPIRQLFSVSSDRTNPFKKEFVENIDFTLDLTLGVLDFTNAPVIPLPVMGNITEVAGAVFAAAAQYQFAVVALDANYNMTTAVQYTSGANAYYTVQANAASLTINWARVSTATGYRIYGKPQSAATNDWAELGIIYNNSTTYQQITTVPPVGGITVPAANTTKHTPKDDTAAFLSYSYPVYSYNSPRRFYDTNVIQQVHGIGSEIANAARLVMGPAGVGHAVSSMYVIAPAISNGEVIGYQDAISAAESIQELILMATSSNNDTVNSTLVAHCEDMSLPENAKERFCFVGTTSAVMTGDIDALTAKIRALDSNRCVFVITDGGKPILSSWQNTSEKLNLIDNTTEDDSYSLNQAVDGQWHAVAMMGLTASLGDPATPPTNKQVYGVSSGIEGTVALWLDAKKDTVAANGGCVLEDRFNNLFVRHALTTSLDSVEDSELSILTAEAYMAKRLRDSNNQYIGRKLTNSLIYAVEYTSKKTLDGLVGDVIISYHTGLSVVQSTANPTWVNVTFDYKPIYPTNVIKFEWGFDLAG